MKFAATPNRVRRPDPVRRTCQFQGCGKHFMGHVVSKYCKEHRGIRLHSDRNRMAVPETCNRTIKHGLQESCKCVLTCAHEGCGAEYRVTLIPRVILYPKYCEIHRPFHRRKQMVDMHVQAQGEMVDPESLDKETLDAIAATDVVVVPLTPPDNPEITDKDLLDVFTANALVDDGDDMAIMASPANSNKPDDVVVIGEKIASEPVAQKVSLTEDSVGAPAPKRFFDPLSTGSIMDPSSDDDAGMVRPDSLTMRTVMADGREIEYAQVKSSEFPVELQGFVARYSRDGRTWSAGVTDYYKSVPEAMATVTTDNSGVYYRSGSSIANIASGTIEIVVDDVVVRRYDSNAGEWRRP